MSPSRHEVNHREDLPAHRASAHDLTMRNSFVAGAVILSVACGHRSGTPPTSPRFSLASGLGSLGPDLRGSYEVTFASDTSCTSLPTLARARTYSLALAAPQVGPTGASIYAGTLSGAEFGRSSLPGYPIWNMLNVVVSDDVAQINFSDPEIWEHLSPETDLQISGASRGTVQADAAEWSFGGTFAYCQSAELDDYPDCKMPRIKCQSTNHHITLTRVR